MQVYSRTAHSRTVVRKLETMKLFLNLFFTLTFLTSFGQSEIGLGIVSINFDDKTKIEFYETSDLNKSLKTIEFFNDESIKSWNIKDLESHKDWLQPESIWLDYGQFKFRCKTKHSDCFEVYVSETQTMWIEKKDFTEFEDWETHLKNMFRVELKDIDNQKIFSRPFDKSAIIEWKDNCFNVKQIQGEWIEIGTAEHCESGEKITGWTKWRNGNQILINYFTTS